MAVPKDPIQKEQWKANLSAAHCGKRGYKHTPQARARISNALKGRVIRGIGWHQSDETRLKISRAQIGRTVPLERRLRIAATLTGRHLSEGTKRKISLAIAGTKKPVFSAAARQRMSDGQKGKQFSDETHALWSFQRTGENHWNWKGGVTPLVDKSRTSPQYRRWRRAVLRRDFQICFDCGERKLRMEVDHIYPFSLFPRLRFFVENGRALCRDCHQQTSTYGGRIKSMKQALLQPSHG